MKIWQRVRGELKSLMDRDGSLQFVYVSREIAGEMILCVIQNDEYKIISMHL